MTLKTFEECVRLQTFNRGGYQQIQLDCHYLREPLQNLVENGTVVEIMLDEVSSPLISSQSLTSMLLMIVVLLADR